MSSTSPSLAMVRRLLPDAGWTLANNVAAVAGGLCFVKLVALFVPAEQTGGANLVLGIVGLLTLVVVQPVLTAHQRIFFDHARVGRSSSFVRSIEPVILRCALLFAGGYLLIAAAYGLSGETTYLRLAPPALLLCILTPHVLAEFNVIEARRRYRALAFAQTLLKAAPAPALAILLWLPISASAAIVSAQAAAYGLAFVIYGSVVRGLLGGWGQRAVPEPDPADPPGSSSHGIGKQATEFGWSLYVYNATFWILSTSDRYILDHFGTHADVGRYALNYGFSALPYLMLGGWIETFTRSRLYARAAAGDREGVRAVMRGKLLLAVPLAAAGTLAMALLARPVGGLLLGATYWHSLTLVLVLCSAYAVHTIANTYTGLLVALKEGRALGLCYALAAAVNVAINIALVPRYGIMGAAVSTLLAFALSLVLLSAASHRALVRLAT